MTLPGSYLDDFAHEHQVPGLSLQLDGRTGTGGRMSAPTTRVFLLPAALYFTCTSQVPGQLQMMMRQAWQEYNLALLTERPAASPFVQLAAALSDASIDGACRLLLKMPEGWQALVSWIEQLMEESLGKGGKGVVVFDDQKLNRRPDVTTEDGANGTLHVRVTTDSIESDEADTFVLHQPSLAGKEPLNRLAALAAGFLGWQLSMALYGYLHHIAFAGQPAVENYKARARTLRKYTDPLKVTLKWKATATDGPLTLLAPEAGKIVEMPPVDTSPASIFARTLQQAVAASDEHGYPQGISLSYLDFTMNGELPTNIVLVLDTHLHRIGNELLGVPVKFRRAPAAYHSTEQSEMDGPPYLVSLRVLMRQHEKSILGTYTDTFLCAQAVSTWQAMLEQGRSCFLLIIDGSADEAVEPLKRFFEDVEEYLN